MDIFVYLFILGIIMWVVLLPIIVLSVLCFLFFPLLLLLIPGIIIIAFSHIYLYLSMSGSDEKIHIDRALGKTDDETPQPLSTINEETKIKTGYAIQKPLDTLSEESKRTTDDIQYQCTHCGSTNLMIYENSYGTCRGCGKALKSENDFKEILLTSD